MRTLSKLWKTSEEGWWMVVSTLQPPLCARPATFFGPPKVEAEEVKTPEAKAAAAVALARTPLLLRFDKEKVYKKG